jgi:hypothetical protein
MQSAPLHSPIEITKRMGRIEPVRGELLCAGASVSSFVGN